MKFSDHFPKVRLRALVIDDQTPMRRVFCRALSEMGVEIIEECSNGEEAIKKMERNPGFNLIVCDLHMEKLSGFDVVTYIRTRPAHPDIPFLLVTGDLCKEIIMKGKSCGVNDICAKPVMPEDFKRKVWAMMSEYLRPSTINQLFRQGDQLFVEKKYYEALAVFRQAKVDAPQLPRSDFSIAQTFYRLGQESESVRILIKNSRQHILYFKNYALLADISIKQKKYYKAIEYLKKELNVNPKQPHRASLHGRILLKLEKYHSALEQFQGALAESPRYEKAMWGLAYCHYKMDNNEKCFSQLKKIRRYHPLNKKTLELMMVLGKEKKLQNPIEMYLRDEINRYPNLVMLYFCLSKHFFMKREYQKSLETMKKVLNVSPGNKEVVDFIESIRQNSPELLTG